MLFLVFGFVFSVSAVTHVQESKPEKFKIEQTVLKADSAVIVSLRSEQLKVITAKSETKELPNCSESNYNLKELSVRDYVAEMSRKCYKIKKHYPITA